MDRPVRDVLASALAALLLAGCASTGEVPPQEGQVALRAGAVPLGPPSAEVVAGPAIQRVAVLVPGYDPAWQAAWVDGGGKGPRGGSGGTYAGLLTGLAFIQAVPMAVMTWPIAAGIVVGMTALGTLGEVWDTGSGVGMDAGDRMALLEAAATLQAERLLRESTAEALGARTGHPPLAIPWHGTWGPDTPGNDPLADARERGADGVLDVVVEAFGLAVAEEADTFGVFVRVRGRLLESAGGRLRYERVLEHGPGRPLAGLPRPASHTLDFLVVDSARVFRYEMREVITRMARILAADPALPLGPR
jgi:hypothetical protein